MRGFSEEDNSFLLVSPMPAARLRLFANRHLLAVSEVSR
jgi:hypothetical protein